jgi:hypothetical protein
MKVDAILQQFLHELTPTMHVTRRQALQVCVSSLLHGNAATVTGIGRGINSQAKEKHNIKRADRLCSNPQLQHEQKGIYHALCDYWMASLSQPVILVDWSDLDAYKRHFLLRASLVVSGRPVTLYEEVHDITTKEKQATHRQFLTRLATALNKDCKPIIVTDAGFKVPWFRVVLALGWDFVGRTRQPNFYRLDQTAGWHCITELYQIANSHPKAFTGQITRSNSLACQLVLYKQTARGRHRLNRSGKPKQSKHSQVHAKGGKMPWLLSTSLPLDSTLARRVVNIYRTRMQIEEGFRDMKSRQYGLGFEQNKSQSIRRLSVLILLTTLASMVLILTGIAVTLAKKHRNYQANSIKNKRVISFQFLGLRAIADRRLKIPIALFRQAREKLNDYALEAQYYGL